MKNLKYSFIKSIHIWANRHRKSFRLVKDSIFSTSRVFFMSFGLIFFIIGSPGVALAATLPTGANVVHGEVDLQTSKPDTLRIIQNSQSAIVNWQSFDIGHGALVDIVQPCGRSLLAVGIAQKGGFDVVGCQKMNLFFWCELNLRMTFQQRI